MSTQNPPLRPRLEAPQPPAQAAQKKKPESVEPEYKYKPQGKLVTALTLVFIAYAIIDIFYGIMSLVGVTVYADFEAKAEAGEFGASVFVLLMLFLGIAILIAIVTTAVLFLVWIYGANRNARALGSRRMTFTPGWCVGWFFIPVGNTYKPLQAVIEIYKASDPDSNATNWKQSSDSALLPLWWLCLIVPASIELILSKSHKPTISNMATWIDIILVPFYVAAVLLASAVVRKIHARQKAKADRLGL